jgi:hypothetical protein
MEDQSFDKIAVITVAKKQKLTKKARPDGWISVRASLLQLRTIDPPRGVQLRTLIPTALALELHLLLPVSNTQTSWQASKEHHIIYRTTLSLQLEPLTPVAEINFSQPSVAACLLSCRHHVLQA